LIEAHPFSYYFFLPLVTTLKQTIFLFEYIRNAFFIFYSFNSPFMNRLTKIFIASGLMLSVINFSCQKEMQTDDKSVISTAQNKAHKSDNLSNSVILEWSNIALEAVGGAAEPHPLLASRIKAMMHIAMHDALNAIVPVYESYTYHGRNSLADPVAAAATAAYTVLKGSLGDPSLDTKLSQSLSTIPEGPGKTEGIALGTAAGNAILDLRAGDGAYQNPISDWPASTVPGVYIIVPPSTFVYAPFWATMQPFSLKSPDQFRSPPPPDLLSHEYTQAFNEVKDFGAINSTVRTADQTAFALWWYELSDIGWNRIGTIQAMNHNTGLYTTARLFALLNMAIADGYTAGFDSKFYYNFWRPYTAIHAAATDGNDGTAADPNWEPLFVTPPIPDYPSTHSVAGNAAAAVLEYFFGNNSPFSMTSTTAVPAGAIRSFESIKKAANENAESRVMVGIHFRFAINAGQKLGDEVGRWTVKNYLEPLH